MMLSAADKKEIERNIVKTVAVIVSKMEPHIISKVTEEVQRELKSQLIPIAEKEVKAMCEKCPFQ
jgi:hypothetical protein